MTVTDKPTTRSLKPIAAASSAAAMLLMLVGGYTDTPFGKHGDRGWGITPNAAQDLPDLPVYAAFAVVGAAVVFGVVVVRGLRREPTSTAMRSLLVATTGLLSLAVSWTGLPVILAAGAALLALDAGTRLGHVPVTSRIALGLAGLTVNFAIWLALAG
jgi:hypothetical protein